MKKEDLLNFYRKFGFEFLKETDEGTLMIKNKNMPKELTIFELSKLNKNI